MFLVLSLGWQKKRKFTKLVPNMLSKMFGFQVGWGQTESTPQFQSASLTSQTFPPHAHQHLYRKGGNYTLENCFFNEERTFLKKRY